MDNCNHPILHDYTHFDAEDEPVFEIRYRDTEALIEGHGTAAQTQTGAQATGPESVLLRTLEGNIQRTTTVEANLQADPGNGGLRRRFT